MSNGSTSNRRILVADDVPGTVEFLAEMLAQRGYEVATAEDGEQCLRQVQEFQPDLVILDIMMPKVHGIDVLKQVRADGTKRDVGFIVCSARSFAVDLKSVRDLGAFDFLMKPFEIQSVLEKVEAFFAGRAPPRRGLAAGSAVTGTAATPAIVNNVEPYVPTLETAGGYWRMWGTRGSIPVSGPRFARHGGNTACLEVRAGDDICIIDAGSGIRDLGLKLAAEGPRKIPILIGHTHWDHIQGFPFFVPAYVPGFEFEIYSASGFGKSLDQLFSGQLDREYFPFEMQDMSARLGFRSLAENPVRFGKIAVYWEMMNHPGATIGFRVEVDDNRIGYITDNEFLKGYLGSPHSLMYSSALVEPYQKIIQFVSDVDVLILEMQYTNEEYPKKIGWGHSSLSNACLLTKLARAKRLVVTHHDPMHDDDFLQAKLNLTRQILKELDYPIEVSNGFDGYTGYF
jgi:CheY-like chemotaxis protein/phosphoribosyl 1,2-cyclic phosphodiesterase